MSSSDEEVTPATDLPCGNGDFKILMPSIVFSLNFSEADGAPAATYAMS